MLALSLETRFSTFGLTMSAAANAAAVAAAAADAAANVSAPVVVVVVVVIGGIGWCVVSLGNDNDDVVPAPGTVSQ